jgi:hypothetical protein
LKVRKRYRIGLWLCLAALFACPPSPALGAAWEKYVLFIPLRAGDAQTKSAAWFGGAVRDAFLQACQSLGTVVALKDDELSSLSREYKLTDAEPEPGLRERIADEKEIALIEGAFTKRGQTLKLTCHVIPGRNEEARTVSVEGADGALRALFAKFLRETLAQLDVSPDEKASAEIQLIPGTDSLAALQDFTQAALLIRPDPRNSQQCLRALPSLEKALKADPNFSSALAAAAWCRLALARSANAKTPDPAALAQAQKEVDRAAAADPGNPWVQNARLDLLLTQKNFTAAVTLGEDYVKSHPMNYINYPLLARAYQGAGKLSEAESLLLRGLDQQGTALQKKPFNQDLGFLLLRNKDEKAEVYLQEVIRLEPKRSDLHFLRASALYRLDRFLDAMTEIQQAEALRDWPALKQLKAMTALALGNSFLADQDADRAYSYTTIASKLRPRHFETNLLMAKVLRKKSLLDEARKQLDLARDLAGTDRPKDHLLLGTEFVAQGYKEEGAKEFVAYLRLDPKAPEREQLIALIRKLRGEPEEQ